MSRLSNARTELENYEKTRPADYVSQYQPKIKDVMGQLDGMKEFDYDPDADTAYQQYKSQYTRSAKAFLRTGISTLRFSVKMQRSQMYLRILHACAMCWSIF